jgi:hypothetical protein
LSPQVSHLQIHGYLIYWVQGSIFLNHKKII